MIILLSTFTILMFAINCSEDCYLSDKEFHKLSSLDSEDIVLLDEIINARSHFKHIFHKINLVRPVGSYNHAIVKQFISDYLSILKWTVAETPFTTETVVGSVDFVNIIATQNVTKSRRLILACHYDSLRKENFFGSTDSALSCAMILSVAELLTPLLNKRTDLDVSLELVFFDGEEAFLQWEASDSLYGSRYLANYWNKVVDDYDCSRLNAIDSLVLLDLLGASRPQFYFTKGGNYRLFKSLANIESKIEDEEDLFRDANHHPYFNVYSLSDIVIQDDHVPFMERGVPIIHLIPVPFPPQWHTIRDNAKQINWKTSKDLQLILTVFLVQYFQLEKELSNHNVKEE